MQLRDLFCRNRKIKRLVTVISAAVLIAGCLGRGCVVEGAINTAKKTKDINYTESADQTFNPERGFYYPVSFSGSVKDIGKITDKDINKCSIIHLRCDIGQFAKDGGLEISEEYLKSLDEELQNIKKNKRSVILRFAYSWPSVDDKTTVMPSQQMILRHIEQLGAVIAENKDMVMNVEVGMYGAWGEMHKSSSEDYAPYETSDVNAAIDKWLSVLPKSLTISVRTPSYFENWVGVDYRHIDSFVSKKDSAARRVGVFNDGYLGSATDYGTFLDRKKEIKWLSRQSTYNYYGGEVIGDIGATDRYNTAKYLVNEAYLTHTSHLNIQYDTEVLNSWKAEKYTKTDKVYYDPDGVWSGKDGYEYVQAHLGYRFVLKEAKLSGQVKSDSTLNLSLKISNVGFGNLVNSKKVTLVLKNNKHTYEFDTGINASKWKVQKLSSVKASIKLKGVKKGKYKVYLRISQFGSMKDDNNYKCISFANQKYKEKNGKRVSIYKKDIGANYIGKVAVK